MNRREFLPMIFVPAFAGWRADAKATNLEWPQWRGPNRDAISGETGLMGSWASGGPKTAWSINGLGNGYGTVALTDDRIYIQGSKDRKSVVFCLNRADGKTIWNAPLGQFLDQDRGPGPRGTPTVDGDRLYALSEDGDLACLRVKDGSSIWHKNILRDFNGRNPHWLLSESPLVDGNMVVFTPGGSGAGMVAVDKMTGHDIWTTKELSDTAGYSSAIVADVQGVRTLMNITARAAVGVRANDGKLMWRYERVANGTANIATPVYSDNKVFYTTAYGTGCALLDLTKGQGGMVKADEAYFNREMMNHHGGVILVNGHIYGFSNAILTCMEFSTGKVLWKNRSVGKGSLTYADGKLFLFSENNVVGLAKASPESYQELGRFEVADQGLPSWAHPVVCGARLYIRNQAMLSCYDIRA